LKSGPFASCFGFFLTFAGTGAGGGVAIGGVEEPWPPKLKVAAVLTLSNQCGK
jgi:hypothetical protein